MLIAKLLESGYQTDPRGDMIKYGNQRTASGTLLRRKFRVKFQEISVRVEVQGLEPHPVYKTLPWLRLTSSYYSNIVDFGDGRMRVGSMILGEKHALEPA